MSNPFERLVHPKGVRVAVTADGRDSRGRFVNGPPPETKEKRLATLTSRTKGQPQTPNMNFAGKINWFAMMLSGLRVAGYVHQLKNHPARKNLKKLDELELARYEERALVIERLATELALEIASFNKRKKLRKMEDHTS